MVRTQLEPLFLFIARISVNTSRFTASLTSRFAPSLDPVSQPLLEVRLVAIVDARKVDDIGLFCLASLALAQLSLLRGATGCLVFVGNRVSIRGSAVFRSSLGLEII